MLLCLAAKSVVYNAADFQIIAPFSCVILMCIFIHFDLMGGKQ